MRSEKFKADFLKMIRYDSNTPGPGHGPGWSCNLRLGGLGIQSLIEEKQKKLSPNQMWNMPTHKEFHIRVMHLSSMCLAYSAIKQS